MLWTAALRQISRTNTSPACSVTDVDDPALLVLEFASLVVAAADEIARVIPSKIWPTVAPVPGRYTVNIHVQAKADAVLELLNPSWTVIVCDAMVWAASGGDTKRSNGCF